MSTININISKVDLGLDQVDNTSDLNKPISTATQTALDTKVDKVVGSRLITSAESTLLGNTSGTNTGDQNLSGLAPLASPTFTGLTTLDTLKVTTGNYITPVDVVGIDLLGNVNRVSASNGRTALGLGSLATQSGTFSGTSSGTNTGDQDLSSLAPLTTATTGSVISFATPQIYNTFSSPSTANITDDLTGAKIGFVQKIYSNKAVAPTVPAGWVLIGTGTYTTSTLNIIFAEWVSGTRVEYWITKPA